MEGAPIDRNLQIEARPLTVDEQFVATPDVVIVNLKHEPDIHSARAHATQKRTWTEVLVQPARLWLRACVPVPYSSSAAFFQENNAEKKKTEPCGKVPAIANRSSLDR